jgi:hypothetical protein
MNFEKYLMKVGEDIKRRNKNIHCPSKEDMEFYFAGALDETRKKEIEDHLFLCASCKEYVDNLIKTVELVESSPDEDIPEGLVDKVIKAMEPLTRKKHFLDLVVGLKEKGIDIIKTTGEFFDRSSLSGDGIGIREIIKKGLIPDLAMAVSYRSGEDSETKETFIKKETEKFLILVAIKREDENAVMVKFHISQKKERLEPVDVRVIFKKDSRVIESRLTENGLAIFEKISPGNYVVEIGNGDDAIGSVNLEVRT